MHRIQIFLLLLLAVLLGECRVLALQDPAELPVTRKPALTLEDVLQRGVPPLSGDLPDVRTPDDGPRDMSTNVLGSTAQLQVFRGGDFVPLEYTWAASGLRHRPLYFEDAMLERHGQACHPLLQPAASGARFFLTFPVLPYALTVNPPRPAICTLGHFRPGSPTPCMLQRPPLQVDAGLVEAGAWLGVIFIFP